MKSGSARAAVWFFSLCCFPWPTSSTPSADFWTRPMTARILVVDDIDANVRLLQAKLQAEYYDVLTAYDGVTALAIAAAEKPDIVLLDVMMPGMDGFQVCRRLKEDPETRHIPVVLVTALDGRADRITGLEAGADEFLTKPIDDLMLFARVKSLTRLKVVIDELR